MTTYEIAQGADRSAISVQGVTESMEYLTSVSSQVRENANHSHKLTEEMVMVLNNSNDTVHQLVEDIKGLAKENQLSLNAVETLDQHAQEIGRIVGLVGSLSEQTNLLALNASIEAARAGEHGKGFAVVAEEVRNLADASGQAVQEITQLVNTVQSETVHVVKLMTKQVETANHAALEGGSVNEAVRNTTELVHEVERSAKTIAELSEKQQERIQQTTEQTQEVAAIAEETSAGTQQVAAAAEEQREMIKEIEDISKTLQLQAQMLKETIHQFTINEE
ncbi:methyl-accepting chemotaxis protein [Bacillus solimangrovi]